MRKTLLLLTVAGAALLAREGRASTCTPGPGDFCASDTVTWIGGSAVVTDTNPGAPINVYAPVVSFSIGNAFNGGPIGSDFPSPSVAADPGGVAGQWNFYDNYVFTVGSAANVQSALISFSTLFSGIGNLEARIFQVSNSYSLATNANYDALAAGDLGNPPMSGTVVEDSWTQDQLSGGIYQVLLNQHAFGTGTYVLQVRGEVDGSPPSGGYGGSISFTPVPLPGAAWTLCGGLVLLAGLWWSARPRPGFASVRGLKL